MRLNSTYAKPEIHDKWESIYRGNPLLDRLNDQIMDRIIGCIQPAPGARFLDAGCGIGDHTARIARKGYECVGIDISPLILEKAEKRMHDYGLSSRVDLYVRRSRICLYVESCLTSCIVVGC